MRISQIHMPPSCATEWEKSRELGNGDIGALEEGAPLQLVAELLARDNTTAMPRLACSCSSFSLHLSRPRPRLRPFCPH